MVNRKVETLYKVTGSDGRTSMGGRRDQGILLKPGKLVRRREPDGDVILCEGMAVHACRTLGDAKKWGWLYDKSRPLRFWEVEGVVYTEEKAYSRWRDAKVGLKQYRVVRELPNPWTGKRGGKKKNGNK